MRYQRTAKRANRPEGAELLGKWVTDPQDSASLCKYGRVVLEFTIDGWLIYTIRDADREQEILLTYRVQEGLIITDQFTAEREERTRYSITAAGKLVLARGRCKSRYIRVE